MLGKILDIMLRMLLGKILEMMLCGIMLEGIMHAGHNSGNIAGNNAGTNAGDNVGEISLTIQLFFDAVSCSPAWWAAGIIKHAFRFTH